MLSGQPVKFVPIGAFRDKTMSTDCLMDLTGTFGILLYPIGHALVLTGAFRDVLVSTECIPAHTEAFSVFLIFIGFNLTLIGAFGNFYYP